MMMVLAGDFPIAVGPRLCIYEQSLYFPTFLLLAWS